MSGPVNRGIRLDTELRLQFKGEMMRVKVTELDMFDFDGGIEEIISRLRLIQAEHPDHVLGIDAYMAGAKGSYDPTEYPVFEVFYLE